MVLTVTSNVTVQVVENVTQPQDSASVNQATVETDVRKVGQNTCKYHIVLINSPGK